VTVKITEKDECVRLEIDGSSGDIEIERAYAKEVQRLFEVFKAKQKSYGRGNISKFGEKGVLIRSSDKLERLLRMVWGNVANPLQDESIEDTWGDLSVYGAIALLCRKGIWK